MFLHWQLWLFSSSRQYHTAAHSLSPGGIGERIGKVKMQELIGLDQDSLLNKAKAMHTSKTEQGIQSLLVIGRQMFSHFQETGAHRM